MDPLARKLIGSDGWAYVRTDLSSGFPDAVQACEACGRSRPWRFVWFHLTRRAVRCLRCGLPGSSSGKRRGGDLFEVAFEE